MEHHQYHDDRSARTILVMGALGLDRLLTVESFPQPDSKVRTTAYSQVGGGNAANTAEAMARLGFFQVRLCSKVGSDAIGDELIQQLATAGVDIEHPLFLRGPKDSTTAFTTVLVAGDTRTCLHTPGSCGELTVDDVESADSVLEGVCHLHVDGRHTEAALCLAKAARRRGLPVSLDVEKDRHHPALDELLELASIVFTNHGQIEDYLHRLTKEYERREGRSLLKETAARGRPENWLEFYAHVLQPSAFFTRWHKQLGKEVVITLGDQGAVHVQCQALRDNGEPSDPPATNVMVVDASSSSSSSSPAVTIHHDSVEMNP